MKNRAEQRVHFPDATFRTYVQGFDRNNDGMLYMRDIDVRGASITSLEVIGYFTSLRTLDCSNNALTTFDLSKNTELQELYCEGNKLTTLDVSGHTKLTKLAYDNNNLTSLNVSMCTVLKELEHLICVGNNALLNLNLAVIQLC